MRVLSAVAVAVLTLLCTAGCGRAGPPGGSEPAATAAPVPTVLRAVDLRLPLDSFLLSPSEVRLIDEARRRLVKRCLASFGLAVTLPRVDQLTGLRSWNERRYGITDAAVAARFGYRLGTRSPAGKDPSSLAVTPMAAAVMSGTGPPTVGGRRVPAGGCTGAANRHLLAASPPGADLNLPQRISMAGFAASRQDPEVTAVNSRWSACMAQRGMHYRTPLDPPKDNRFQGPVTAAEVEVARADIACKARTNLVGVWYTAEAHWQRGAVRVDAVALDLAGRANKAQLAAAAAVGS